MKFIVANVRVYDPKTGEIRLEPHTLNFSSKAEFLASIAALKAKYQRLDGEKPNG